MSRKLALIVTENISPFLLSIPQTVFGSLPENEKQYEIFLCTEKPGMIPLEGGLYADVKHGLDSVLSCDLVIVPYWHDPFAVPSAELISALQNARQSGIEIAGLCRGAFVLGYAGLLKNRRATAHWCDTRALKQLFPDTQVESSALYTDEDGIITSAGIAAGIDCCLHILRKHCGAHAASTAARMIVAPPFREGGQAQFIDRPVPVRTSDLRINRIIDAMSRHLEADWPLEKLAESAAMSTRTFYRTFQKATGMTPGQWLTEARLRRAQELLEESSLSVEAVAEHCGFGSAVTFRQRFKAACGVSPQTWRQTFAEKRSPSFSR